MLVTCDLFSTDDTNDRYIYLWFGNESGTEWSEPMPTGCIGFMPDRILQLDEKHLLLTVQTSDPATGKRDIRCYHSFDLGVIWSDPVFAIEPPELQFCEPSVVEASNGDLVMLLRENSDLGLDCYELVSHDQDLSWDGPFHAPIPGCHRPVCARLSSGNCLISYRFMHGGMGRGFKAQNQFAALMNE